MKEKKVPIMNKNTGEVTQGTNLMAKKNVNKKSLENATSPNSTVDAIPNKNNSMEKEDKVSTTVSENKPTKTKSKKKDPESIEEFLELFFNNNKKALPEKLAISFNRSISEYSFEDVESLKKFLSNDRSLEKTRKLLLLLIKHKPLPKLEKLLKNVVRNLIIHSEIYKPVLKGYFPLVDGQPYEDLDALWSSFVLNFSDSKGEKPDPNLVKARKNVFFCAVLWQFNGGQLSLEKCIKILHSSIFSTQEKKGKTDNIILEYLSANSEGENCKSLSSFLDWFYKQTDDLSGKHAQLIQDKCNFEKLFNEQRGLVQTKDEEISVLKYQVESFQLQIKQTNETQRVEKIHLQDDQRKQKGRTLRAIEEELPMLQDALKALEREPAKVAVAKDYLGRALDNLSNELEQLRRN